MEVKIPTPQRGPREGGKKIRYWLLLLVKGWRGFYGQLGTVEEKITRKNTAASIGTEAASIGTEAASIGTEAASIGTEV